MKTCHVLLMIFVPVTFGDNLNLLPKKFHLMHSVQTNDQLILACCLSFDLKLFLAVILPQKIKK
jgi:hypothetical protein